MHLWRAPRQLFARSEARNHADNVVKLSSVSVLMPSDPFGISVEVDYVRFGLKRKVDSTEGKRRAELRSEHRTEELEMSADNTVLKGIFVARRVR